MWKANGTEVEHKIVTKFYNFVFGTEKEVKRNMERKMKAKGSEKEGNFLTWA